jgi:hypothetical protein
MRFLLLFFMLVVNASYAGLSFQTIKEYGLLASASYRDVTKVSGPIAETSYLLDYQSSLGASGVSYFLATKQLASNEAVQLISFRGTSNIENVLVNLNVSLMPDEKLGVLMHEGFSAAAMEIFLELRPRLDKAVPVVTTGHSLGGAIAQIVALHLQLDGFHIQQVVTFGQPKVTNVTGAALFNRLPLTRVVTVKDIVPLVPPLSPLQLKNLNIYWHSGREIILLPGSEYSILSGLKSMMRATTFVKSVPDETNLNAHLMTTYLDLIESKLVDSTEVTYKSGVSVFGFNFD